MLIRYSSNNSGGDWWLTDDHWRASAPRLGSPGRGGAWRPLGLGGHAGRRGGTEVSDPLTPEERAFAEVRAERDAALARLEKARGLVLEFAANMGPGFFDSYPTLVKLRAALAIGAEPSRSEEHHA